MNPIQRRLLAIIAVALVFASFFYYLQKKVRTIPICWCSMAMWI